VPAIGPRRAVALTASHERTGIDAIRVRRNALPPFALRQSLRLEIPSSPGEEGQREGKRRRKAYPMRLPRIIGLASNVHAERVLGQATVDGSRAYGAASLREVISLGTGTTGVLALAVLAGERTTFRDVIMLDLQVAGRGRRRWTLLV
jgi:hypothetical protein